MQLNVFGQQLPVAGADCGNAVVIGSSAATTTVTGADSSLTGGVVQSVGEIAVCGHAVVPVRGSDMLGAFARPARRARCSRCRALRSVTISALLRPSQLADGSAPAGGFTEQLRSKEHALDVHPTVLQPLGRFHGEGGAGGMAPQLNVLPDHAR